jgi:hypothetical protein
MPKCISCKKAFNIWTSYSTSSKKCNDCLKKVWEIQESKRNAPPSEECYLFMNGEQKGPFTTSQILAMWQAGNVTADALFFDKNLNDWIPANEFINLHKNKLIDVQTQATDRRKIGAILALLGVIVLIYFAVFYDVSVQTTSHYISGIGTVGGESVVNLGKQQDRLIGVLIGISLGVVGAIMRCLPSKV